MEMSPKKETQRGGRRRETQKKRQKDVTKEGNN